MKKDTKNRKLRQNEIKFYNPDKELVEWVQKRILLEQKRREYEKRKSKKNLPKDFQNELKSSGARKSEILNNKIFPSMANLIFFFEALMVSSSLRHLLHKDIIKLLDPRKSKSMAEVGQTGMNFQGVAFRNSNLARLVRTALSLEIPKAKERSMPDFRIGILFQLQTIIRDEIYRYLTHVYGFSSQITKSVTENLDNSVGWLGMITLSLPEGDEEYDREMGFRPIWFSNKAVYSEWQL